MPRGFCLQVLADIEAKYRVKMAASNGRLEDAMESVALHDGRRRPGRRSNYEILLKVGPSAQLPFGPHGTGPCDFLAFNSRQLQNCNGLLLLRPQLDLPCHRIYYIILLLYLMGFIRPSCLR